MTKRQLKFFDYMVALFLGARKKAFGQIDQPKGTKPREIRALGVRRKVEVRLQRADRQQTKQEDQARRPRRPRREEEKVWGDASAVLAKDVGAKPWHHDAAPNFAVCM